jgi:hypothetical protein
MLHIFNQLNQQNINMQNILTKEKIICKKKKILLTKKYLKLIRQSPSFYLDVSDYFTIWNEKRRS